MSERRDILGRIMTETGTTQSELSRLSGVRQPSISQMLSGRVEPSDEMLGRLLSCMGFGLEIVRRPVRLELPRSVRRSWLLHRRISTLLDQQTLREWTPRILGNIEQLRGRVRGEPHRANLERWNTLVGDGDLPGLHRILTGLGTDAIEMREVSPMLGLLTQRERDEVLQQRVGAPDETTPEAETERLLADRAAIRDVEEAEVAIALGGGVRGVEAVRALRPR